MTLSLMCNGVQLSSFYVDTNHIWLGPILLQYNLILIDYIRNNPNSN